MALKLTQLASKPQLIKITIDKPEIVEAYGDELEFYIWDRQPIEQFIKMANSQGDTAAMIQMVNDLILDENGDKVIKPGEALPNDVMVVVINTVVDRLGK